MRVFAWLKFPGNEDTRGVAAVEFALILPVVLALFFAIVEFGSILYTRQLMYFAARESARSYVTGISATTDAAVTAAEDTLVAGAGPATFTTTVAATGLGTSTSSVTVTIETTMADAALLNAIPDFAFGDRTLTANVTMFIEDFAPANTNCGDPCTASQSSTGTVTP